MTSENATTETALSQLVGQMAWQVRADEHGCVMMEFGAPHLDIRQPMPAKTGSSPALERLRARRVVTVLGDWHLWIESCNWTLRTRTGSVSSEDETSNLWQDWMDDTAGQHLIAAESSTSGALTLNFDGGTVLEVRPRCRWRVGQLESLPLARAGDGLRRGRQDHGRAQKGLGIRPATACHHPFIPHSADRP